MNTSAQPGLAKEEDQPKAATVSLFFPKKTTSELAGFDTAELDGEVSITIKGKVNSLSASSDEWGGKTVGVDIASCRIDGGKDYAEPMGMGEAVERTRTRV